MSFIYHNHRNPCPVCGSTKGKCRTSDKDLVFCLTFVDGDSDNRDYKFIRPSRGTTDGMWGIHAPRRQDDWNPEQAAQQRAARQAEQAQREKERLDELAQGLPLGRRSSEFRQFLLTLKLDADHRQNLRERGLTDTQIDAGLFRSIKSGQRVKAHPSLPGVKHGRLWFGKEGDRGFICPAFNSHGQITGLQIRLDDSSNGRYRWVKGKFTSHLQTGELPITTIIPDQPKGIMLAEGLLKPDIAAHRHGYAAIGAAGGLFSSSPEQLQNELQALSKRLDTQIVLLAPDAGSRANKQVWQRDTKTIRLIQSWGYTVKIGDWGQRDTKNAPDIDELANLENVQWVDPDFAPENAIAPAPKQKQSGKPQTFEELITWIEGLAGVLPSWISSLDHLTGTVRKWAKELGHNPKEDRQRERSLLSTLNQFRAAYRIKLNAKLAASQVMSLEDAPVGTFNDAIKLPENERRLYLLNGQKGTRKTSGAIRSIVQSAKQAGLSVLMVVPTRFLSRDSANRLGMACHLDERESLHSRYVMTCPESVHKFAHQEWDIIIIDETNEGSPRSWLGSLGNTPKESRQALTDSIAAAPIVVLSQDGLYKPVVQAVQRLGNFTEAQTEVIERRRPQNDQRIVLYLSNENQESWDGAESEKSGRLDLSFYGWLTNLSNAISEGKRVAIPSGSRAKARQLYRYLRQQYPDKKITIVDGRDSFSSLRNAIAQDFDGWLNENQPDIVIWTPVFNSGVSIESDYFDAQYEYVSPFETATSASQRGERVRTVLGGGKIQERHVFIQRKGLPTDVPEEVLQPGYWRECLTNTAEQGLRGILSELSRLGLKELSQTIREAKTPSVEEYPELADVLAIQAREIHLKVEQLRSEWSGNGWEIYQGATAEIENAKAIALQMSWVAEGIIDVRSRTYAKAPSHFQQNHSLGGFNKFERSVSAWEFGNEPRGPIDAAHFHKWDVEKAVGNHPWLSDPDWWAAFDIDDPHAISALRLRALILMPDEDFQSLERWSQHSAIGRVYASGAPDLPVSHREIGKAALLRQAPGIHDVLTGQLARWDKDHPIIGQAKKWAVQNAKQLAAFSRHEQRWFGFQFTDKTPEVKCMNKLLSLAGHETKCDRSHKGRTYRLKIASDVDDAIAKLENSASLELKVKRLERQRYRLENDEQTFNAIAAHIHNQQKASASASEWLEFEAQLIARGEYKDTMTELQITVSGSTTEVLSCPKIPDPPPPQEQPTKHGLRVGDTVEWKRGRFWYAVNILGFIGNSVKFFGDCMADSLTRPVSDFEWRSMVAV